MGKRSNFQRHERDYYPTPPHAIDPLLPHIGETDFIEPCAGDYRLAEYLESKGSRCMWAFDIEPQDPRVECGDIFAEDWSSHSCEVITNPPWDRKILHPIIEKLTKSREGGWLLFDADWMHTKQSKLFMPYCNKIVSVGRVKWFDNKAGKDNAAWYQFSNYQVGTEFFGR